MPKQVSAGLMFGTVLSVPVPDVDRTDYLLILGANPLASNGSLLTAPDMRGRLRAIRARGGKVVVIDPRRTRTAEEADEHHFIRPGTDALFLFALVHVLFDEGLAEPGPLAEHCDGLDEVAARWPSRFTPEAVAPVCGIARRRDPAHRARAGRRADAPPCTAGSAPARRSSARSRAGSSTCVNVLTGNLDRPGGAMFTRAAAGSSQHARASPAAARASASAAGRAACAGCPRSFGELPVACLAEEIETPGEGQIRALVTIAGNPAVSTPNAERLARALRRRSSSWSRVDIYVNETTRHADVILPAPSPLQRSRTTTSRSTSSRSATSPTTRRRSSSRRRTAAGRVGDAAAARPAIVAGQGADADVEALDDFVAGGCVERELQDARLALDGRDAG